MEPEEERPSFFKVLVGDFSQQLLIPRAFVKNFNGCVPPILRGPCGACWTVNLKEIENHVVFHRGWELFVRDRFLEVGNFLTFTYDGVSMFDVTIYGKSYCKKDVEVTKSKNGSLVDRTSRDHIISGKGPAIDHMQELSIGSIAFKSDYPPFVLNQQFQGK